MIKINENFLELQNSYLFTTVAKKIQDFQEQHPDKKVIKLGIGDVTKPLVPAVIKAMHKAVDEMANPETFRGYGPEIGYNFLKKAIVENDYKNLGITEDEVFISDGINTDISNIVDILDCNSKVSVIDPVYPVYVDTNVMGGRSGKFNKEKGEFERIIYLPVSSKNNFIPELPTEIPDIIYMCFPNNPTGTVLTKSEMQKFVDYAQKNKVLLLFDAAYEAFITENNIPHSIYELEGAKEVAIEFKSFSKTAGFTGIRCAYSVVPKELFGYKENGEKYPLNPLWDRRVSTKTNGVSYITQRGAEAVYSEEGKKQIKDNIAYYMENAKIIKNGLIEAGYTVFGGQNSPYIWLKTPNNMTSWEFFDMLLEKANVAGTPGSGFGPSGEGYFRLTAFGTKENTLEAIERIKNMK